MDLDARGKVTGIATQEGESVTSRNHLKHISKGEQPCLQHQLQIQEEGAAPS